MVGSRVEELRRIDELWNYHLSTLKSELDKSVE
jgi:hypothetical protein